MNVAGSSPGTGQSPKGHRYKDPTWTPEVCKIVALMAVIMVFGLLFYIHLGFR